MKIGVLAKAVGYTALGGIIALAGASVAAGEISLVVCKFAGEQIKKAAKKYYDNGKHIIEEVKK